MTRSRPPAGTTIRFIVLILLVAVAGLFSFIQLFYLFPPSANHFFTIIGDCLTATTGYDPNVDVGAVTDTYRTCESDAFRLELWWFLGGFAVLVGLTVLLYLTYPAWVSIRNDMKPYLPNEYNAAVLQRLSMLADRMDVHPAWYSAGRAVGSAGGRAFGLPGRRRVSINPPLITLCATDPQVFDATVLHELAHLRNRDLDLTALTIAILWSFVAVAVVPVYALVPLSRTEWYQDRLVTPSAASLLVDWRLLLIQSLALTVLVYVARNAVLRVRELQADATSAAYDRATPELLRRLYRQSNRHGLMQWIVRHNGTHPSAATRLAAREQPEHAWRPALPELTMIGLAVGLLASNLHQLGSQVYVDLLRSINTFHPDALIGLCLGPVFVALLLISLWQRTGERRAPYLTHPLALLSGLYLGLLAPLLTRRLSSPVDGSAALTRWWRGDVVPVLGASAALLVGAIVLALWFRAATEPDACPPHHTRWVIASATLAASPWFAAWYVWTSLPPIARTNGLSCWIDGATQGRYAEALLCPPAFPALNLVEVNPAFLLGLTLMWLLPLGFAGPLRVPLVAGACAGLTLVGAGIGLAFWTRDRVPEANRNLSTAAGAEFFDTYWHTYLAMVLLVQIVTAAALLALVRSRCARTALLTMSIIAVLATLAQLATWATARCLDLWGRHPTTCVPPLVPTKLAADLHTITLYSLLAVTPVILLGSALPRIPSRATGPTRAGGIALTAVLIAILIAVVLNWPLAWTNWVRWG
ncbi:M48 family metalloprotease [Nocardia sp. NPDC056100]|uniref:M48 family metalloprotease n=1 Tax=Nocardia sp. NPDC056100 TaxID=3345712 RepID=UPI0035E216DE